MAYYVQKGNAIDYINPGNKAIQHGDVVVFPSRIGIAAAEIPPGETGAVSLAEAFCFPTAAETIPIGTAVYWDAAAACITKTETGNTPAGIAITEKAGTAAGEITVRLEQV